MHSIKILQDQACNILEVNNSRHHCGLQASMVTRRWLRFSWEQGPTLTYRKQWGQF